MADLQSQGALPGSSVTEPRGFITTDWFAASLAIAVVMAKPRFGAMQIDAVFLVVVLLVTALHLSLLFVAIGRQIRFARGPASSEWYLVFGSAILMVGSLPTPDSFLDWVHQTLADVPLVAWTTWRWGLGWAIAAMCSGFAAAARWSPKIRDRAIWKIALPLMALLFAWGPLGIFRTYMTLPAMDWIEVPLDWYERAYIDLQAAVQIFPVLFASYTTVFLATVNNGHPRSQWSWLDWSSATLALLAGLLSASPLYAVFAGTVDWTFSLVHWPIFFATLALAYSVTRPTPRSMEHSATDRVD